MSSTAQLEKRILGETSKTMNDLVSVIMPAYNCEAFIAESVRSVQAQTYENWELLIVDDCSSDNTLQVINEFAVSDDRIKVLVNEKNSGAAISRNYAMREAKGKWIAFLDGDDLWLPEKLEKQIFFMEKNDYHFSFTSYKQIRENDEELGIRITGPKKVGRVKMHLVDYLGCLTVIYDSTVTGLIQVADLKKRNDYAIWLKASKFATAYYLAEDLALYRVRESNSLTSRNKGLASLIPYHYRLFREGQGYNRISSAFFTSMNVVFYIFKRLFYRKKYNIET